MYSTVNNRVTPSAQQLYRKIISKISYTEPNCKAKLKKQIALKYDKHMSLLQSHQKRQIRFEQNYSNIQKMQNLANKQLKNSFKEKQQQVLKFKANTLNQKKKRISDSLNEWQQTVQKNEVKYSNSLKQSDNQIRKWNQKCEVTTNKKKQRLNTISSNSRVKSKELSAKCLKYRQEQYEMLLQRALVNPEKQKSSRKASQPKIDQIHRSRVSSSRVSTSKQYSMIHQISQQKFDQCLQSLVKKQIRIIQARNKKNQLIRDSKKSKHLKQLQIEELHRRNNHLLMSKKKQGQLKLDEKFVQDRSYKSQTNKSLPSISTKASPLVGRSRAGCVASGSKGTNTHKVMGSQFNSLINQELRNIALAFKMRRLTKQ